MGTPEERAMEALEGMSETWAEREGIAQHVNIIPVNCTKSEHQERAHELILRLVKQAYLEGMYNGFTAGCDYARAEEGAV